MHDVLNSYFILFQKNRLLRELFPPCPGHTFHGETAPSLSYQQPCQLTNKIAPVSQTEPEQPFRHTAGRTLRRWGPDILITIGLLTALSMYLVKDMLAVEQQVPQLHLPALSAVSENTSFNEALTTVHWQNSDKTLVYFFAPWCSICSVSMRGLSLLPDTDAQIIVVALDWQNITEVQDFVDRVGYEGKVLLGSRQTQAAYKIDAYPSYYVVDSTGSVIHRDRGFTTPPGLFLRLN